MKPFEPYVVKRRVQNIIELNQHRLNQEELIEEQAARLRESNSAMIDALSSIIEYRSAETGQHIRRIRIFTKALLEDVASSYPEYGLENPEIQMIVSASSMHDIGKIAIPDAILNKPGRLTKEEFEIMKTHSVKGCEILAGLDRMSDRQYLKYAYNICRYHHERWDGRGYPDGLKGDSIPIYAQVVGIADCYDALTLTAMLLSVFLLKKRAQDKVEETAAGFQMALNNQNSWIYIIDPDDFHLIYINEKTIRMAPDVKKGMYCYEAFFARTRPCEECPAKNIRRNINRIMEIFNPVLNVWTEADASLIRWGEKDACMLSCHDITRYK